MPLPIHNQVPLSSAPQVVGKEAYFFASKPRSRKMVVSPSGSSNQPMQIQCVRRVQSYLLERAHDPHFHVPFSPAPPPALSRVTAFHLGLRRLCPKSPVPRRSSKTGHSDNQGTRVAEAPIGDHQISPKRCENRVSDLKFFHIGGLSDPHSRCGIFRILGQPGKRWTGKLWILGLDDETTTLIETKVLLDFANLGRDSQYVG